MKQAGRNAVLELLKTDRTIDKILLEKGAQGVLGKIFAEARKKNIRVQFVDRAVLDREYPEKRHQGVIAFTTDFRYCALDSARCGMRGRGRRRDPRPKRRERHRRGSPHLRGRGGAHQSR